MESIHLKINIETIQFKKNKLYRLISTPMQARSKDFKELTHIFIHLNDMGCQKIPLHHV
jgi:hypothetical protein